MASAVIGALRVNLGIDSAAFQNGLKSAQSSMASFGQKLKIGMAAAATAAAAALTGVGYAIKGILQDAREFEKLAQISNAGFEEFQRLAYGAKTVGIEAEKLGDIFKDVNDRVGDFVATGGGPMKDFFDNIAPKVGVTAEAFRNLSGPQALQLYYDSLVKAGASQQDLTFYMEAMASDTTALIPLLANGGAEFARLAAEADKFGIVIDQRAGARAKEFNATLDRIGAVMKGVVTQIMSAALPAMQALADTFFNASGENERLKFVIDAAVISFKALASAGIATVDAFRALSMAIVGAYNAATLAVGGDFAGAGAALSKTWDDIGAVIAKSADDIKGIWSDIEKETAAVPDFVPRLTGQLGLPQAVAAHKQAAKEVGDAWSGLREATRTNEAALDKFGDSAQEVARTVSSSVSSWVDSAIDRTFSLREAVGGLLRDVGKMMVNRAVMSLLGGFNLPGFANGGSFKVGGSGGVDSQLVAFKASPDETVSITKPGQVAGGQAGSVYAPAYNIDARGATEGTAEQIRKALEDYDRAAFSRHVAMTRQSQRFRTA